MRHTFLPLTRLALSCLSVFGCTKLEDPNETFGQVSAGGSTGASANGGSANGGVSTQANAGGVAGRASGGGAPAFAGAGGGGAGAGGQSCQDATGFHGLGCNRCAPVDVVSLENACTSAACTPFANDQRLSLLGNDGKLPDLPVAGTGGGAGTAGSAGTGTAGTAGGVGGGSGVGKACADFAQQGTLVYVTGSSAAKPFLQQIAQQLVGSGIYLVYTSTGSCIGVDAVVNGTPMTTGSSPALAASATYWDSSSSNGVACDLPAGGVAADIGASDVFAQSCAGFELTNLDSAQIRDAHGPIQTMTFAVPANSAYSEISAQAAYFVFGFGKDGGVRDASGAVAIWNDESYLFARSPSSGTQAMLAAAIGVPASAWRGKPHKTSDDVAADIQAAGQSQETANQAIGILAADYIDSKNLRAQVRVLAYQDSSQACAVFPDSTSSAHDKKNVRDGHYPVWGPLHLLLKVDQFGNPVNAGNRQAVSDIVGYLSGTKVLPNGVQLIDVYAQSGLIPECAMHVTRSKDGGNILPYLPASPCSCVFEAKATGSTTCTACKVQGDCSATQTCSQGYCEG